MSDVPLPDGFRAAGTWCGIKKEGRGFDLGVLLAEQSGPAAAMFTQNRLCGAHVTVCREHLAATGGLVRAIVANSGNANCATGTAGIDDARAVCRAVARELGCEPSEVLPISTGVIGARLPVERILAALAELCAGARRDRLPDFARAVMTTDTHPKAESVTLGTGGTAGRVSGVAKGAGMIHPDMATMLGFLVTDVRPGSDAAAVLRAAVDRTFHRLTIDGDTSPNDTVVLWSSAQKAGDGKALAASLVEVGVRLCRQIARDGEGATRLVTVQVRGARTEAEATLVGRTIATSPLTKTAVTGRDPNWGRILSAAGRAGVEFDAARARVWIGDSAVYEHGKPWPERERAASQHLRDCEEVVLGVDLAVGDAAADVWTCDLTADYVRINADYRT